MKKIISLITILILLLPSLAACAPQQKIYQAQFFELFDTVTVLMGYADTQEEFGQRAEDIKQDIGEFHKLYDIYNSYEGYTNLHDVNQMAGQGPIVVDSRILDLLEFSKQMYAYFNGKVNVAMGAVLRIWHEYRSYGQDYPEEAALPERSELEEAAKHCNIDDIVIDRQNSTVTLLDRDMSLDVGAIAKGYAAERVAKLAQERGEEHLLISLGGNVRAIGARNDAGETWRVGIEKPVREEGDNDPYTTILKVVDQSLVTSGLYARYYVVNDKRYHHIIDPVTLFPEDRFLSVSVLTHDSGLADALSTTLYNSTIEEGKALIESIPGTEVLWVLMDGQLVRSSGFAALEIEALP